MMLCTYYFYTLVRSQPIGQVVNQSGGQLVDHLVILPFKTGQLPRGVWYLGYLLTSSTPYTI